jgi:hypothetical protein
VKRYSFYNVDYTDLMDRLSGWRIFLCTDTRYIGLAPSIAARGDILIAVEGADDPCLMRPAQNGCWRLISGDCFAICYDPAALALYRSRPREARMRNTLDVFENTKWKRKLDQAEEFVVI